MTGAAAAPADPEPPGELPLSVNRWMAMALRVGLIVALALFAGALAALVVRSAGSASGTWVSTNALVPYLDLRRLARGLAAGTPEAYLTLGVYALIATPVVRVATGLGAFLVHEERRMAALTSVVLVLLFVGLLVVGPLVR